MEQRISLVTLGVADIAAARRFYEALGWKTDSEPDSDVAFFQAGAIVFALWGDRLSRKTAALKTAAVGEA